MNINELDKFNLEDSVKFHDSLNPAIWTEKGKLDPEVKEQLLKIAKDFLTELGIGSFKVEDITLSGSNASYTYTPHSDLDLHILVDYNKLPDDEVYQELFNAKKTLYNDMHDIKVHGVPVELYVQDSNQPVVSAGEFSLLKDKWIKLPKKEKVSLDHNITKAKYEKLGNLIELALKSKNLELIEKSMDVIKRYRKAGLADKGEFSPENLAFKALRSQGYIKKLYDLKNKLHSKELSIENVNEILDKKSAAKVYWSEENYMTDAPISQMYTTYTAAAQDKNKNILKYNFYNFPKHDLTAIEFSRAVGPWGDNFSIDNAGDQYTVFSTLIEVIRQYLSDDKPEFIVFGAKEPSRAKLYQTFVNRFASKFGYKQISPDSIPKPVSSMILNRGDTPFLLQKVGSKEVNEILDTKSKAPFYDMGSDIDRQVPFKTKSGYRYGIDFVNSMDAPSKPRVRVFPKIKPKLLPFKDEIFDRGVEVVFGLDDYNVDNATGITGTGSAAEVFGIVTNKIVEYIKKFHPPYLYFTSLDDEVSRVKLYKSLLRRIIPTLPEHMYKIIKIENGYQFVILDKDFFVGETINEVSGYIPSQKEKNDPRFKTALTVDVKPDSIKKNAKAFGWKVDRTGKPPLLRK